MSTQYPQDIWILLGPTGSGKDTQAELLARHFGYKIIKLGRLVRALAKTNKKIAQSIQNGELASDDIVNQLIVDNITSFKSTDKILIDGFPREIKQAEWLDTLLRKNDTKVSHAIYIDIPDDEVFYRLAHRKRLDDQHDNIAKRLAIFHERTSKVIAYYRAQGKLRHVDGTGSVNQVFSRIKGQLS